MGAQPSNNASEATMIARAARSFRISGSSRLRYRSDQSVRSLLEWVRSGGLTTEAFPSARAEVLIQHGLHAGLTHVQSGFRCVAVRYGTKLPRSGPPCTPPGGAAIDRAAARLLTRRTSGREARRQAQRIRHSLHRHLSLLAIGEDFPDSSFVPVLPSPCLV